MHLQWKEISVDEVLAGCMEMELIQGIVLSPIFSQDAGVCHIDLECMAVVIAWHRRGDGYGEVRFGTDDPVRGIQVDGGLVFAGRAVGPFFRLHPCPG